MASVDTAHVERAQFAFAASAHIIFPALSIGLATYLAVLEGLWLRTGRWVYLDLFRYRPKPFSLAFGMGVVSGLVMSYQFGTGTEPITGSDRPFLLAEVLPQRVLSALAHIE